MSWQKLLNLDDAKINPQKTQKRGSESFEDVNLGIDFLKRMAGDDWHWISINPEALVAYRQLMDDRALMASGLVPDSYCHLATCDHCGEVPLYVSGRFAGCPWCLLGGYKVIAGGSHS